MNSLMRILVVIVASGACVVSSTVRYQDLDQMVHHATGKHLYDRFTERDLELLEDKAWAANLGDLVRITDETKRLVRARKLDQSASGLTGAQKEQVLLNLQLAFDRVLTRVTEMRKSEAKRKMRLGGCTTPSSSRGRRPAGC